MATPETWPDIAHMSREQLEAEVAALRHALNAQRDELTKVKGYRAELSERCYRKDLELDELRVRDRACRDAARRSPVAVSTSVDGMSPAEWGDGALTYESPCAPSAGPA